MREYIAPISVLVDEFAKLPGIGRKTARKLAFWILEQNEMQVSNFARAMVDAKNKVSFCDICGHFTDNKICYICSDKTRDHNTIVVVEDAKDVFVVENTNEYKGVYHVLHGAISPLDGVSPNDINIKELLSRLDGIEEVILATNPTIEGEATAMYISKLIKPLDIKVTRIAKGIPIGGDIEYADEVTLSKSFEGRREI